MYDWDEKPDLNITPFVDVMLVLMSILMVTAPTITYQEKIELPEGSKSVRTKKISQLSIKMDKNHTVHFRKERYSLKEFAQIFKLKTLKENKKIDVFILADANLPYKDVMRLLKIIKEAGFSKVSLLTE